METFLLLLLELAGDLALAGVGELLGFVLEVIFERSVGGKPGKDAQAAIACVILSAALASLSVVFYPHHLIAVPWERGLNLVVTPLIVAGIFVGIGKLRRANPPRQLERFPFAWLFAFVFAGTRLLIAK